MCSQMCLTWMENRNFCHTLDEYKVYRSSTEGKLFTNIAICTTSSTSWASKKKNRQHRATSILYFNFRFSALSNPIYFEHISVTHMEFHKFEVPQNILHFYSVQNTDKKFRKTLISFIYILIRGTVGDVQQTLMRILFERYFFSFLTLSAWSLKFSHNFRRCPTNNKKCQSTALIFLSSVLFLSFPFHSFLYI